MSHQLSELLASWMPLRDSANWVLGVIYRTEGPCYRKAGAMMLFSSQGHQLGMLSGGCLESDISRHARRVMLEQRVVQCCYDGSDEDDMAYQLGIGCGGVVYIQLMPVNAANQYLQLDNLSLALEAGQQVDYQLQIDANASPQARCASVAKVKRIARADSRAAVTLKREADSQWLQQQILPVPRLLVIGGGIDAQPLVNIASQLGWLVNVWDPRPANARAEHFAAATELHSGPIEQLVAQWQQQPPDAAVVMSHNLSLDAAALGQLANLPLSYLGLLGPLSRRQRVLEIAGLSEAQLRCPIAGPAGLPLGGDLPESIALSIISQCHAALHGSSAHALAELAA